MKEIQFMSNPSGNQSVQAIPGIGRVNGERLSSAGFNNVSSL
jgi:Barrier to autointegration factor